MESTSSTDTTAPPDERTNCEDTGQDESALSVGQAPSRARSRPADGDAIGTTCDGASTTRRGVLTATGAGIAGVLAHGITGTAGAVGGSTPPLHTDGRWIRDPNGNAVKFRGFATAGLDFIDESWYPFSMTEVLHRATDGEAWHPNTIRLPVTEWAFIEQGASYVVDDLLRPAVDVLADRGVYAVIDFHMIRPYVEAMANAEGMVADGWAETIDDLGFDANVPTDQLLGDFWSAVAPEFENDDHVLYELFNEPTMPVTWSSYGQQGPEITTREDEWLLWRDTAQPWVDTIRAHAPETPIIVGSPDWTSRTAFAPQYPFQGDNLVYASHIYPPNGRPYQEYEHDGTVMEPFDPEYGAPANDVPVVCTEFGWDPDVAEDSEAHGTTSGWGDPFRQWVESYDNMGWLGWCFDYAWGPTFFDAPEGDTASWTLKDGPEQHGGFIQTWLAETVGESGGTDTGASIDPLPDGSQPGDLNGDGLYRDVNGNGRLDNDDVVTYFEQMDSAAVQNNVAAFDFNANGRVDFDDLVTLFESL